MVAEVLLELEVVELDVVLPRPAALEELEDEDEDEVLCPCLCPAAEELLVVVLLPVALLEELLEELLETVEAAIVDVEEVWLSRASTAMLTQFPISAPASMPYTTSWSTSPLADLQ